ncbi:MAG: ABC transporter substrate-binding protein [Plectolyngbya sp. WJT66-NPBG17]|jgi:NitT/TauT family transport system substrate-binding protein/sulfonate transport system substrate-binding protein|nr:ABC transporter substrate-binding protein [Plectolyngbya sp. WJT66-NPBG17]MBW4528950.1 ABC transporter substrate-binding protein [Phormidium tanganyikae FI6-MK23]
MRFQPFGRRTLLKHLLISTATASLAITLSNCTAQPKVGETLNSSPVASPAASSAKSRVLRVGFITTDASKVPVSSEGWAQDKGYLTEDIKALGITEIKFIPFVGGPALNESIAAGALDIGIYGDTPAIVGRAAGLKTKLINQGRVGQDSWLLTAPSGVKSLEELKGQKVGVAKGTYMHRYLLGLLDRKELTKDVKLVQIPVADAKSALERGDIAAYPFSTGSGPLLATKGFSILDQAKNHEGLVGTSATAATKDFLANNPEFPKVWNQIRQKALQEIKSKPDEFYQFAAKASGDRYPLPVIQESYGVAFYPDQPFTPEGLKLLNSTKQFLAEQKLLKSEFEIKDWQVSDSKS